jgi:hypothetical protein
MIFFLFGDTWKEMINNFGKIGLIEKKKTLKLKNAQQKKGLAQPLAIFLHFLIVMLLGTKMILNKCF